MNWRDIPGCAGYQVSDTGQVRNSRTGRLLKPRRDTDGYLLVDLWIGGKKTVKVHRAVATAFLQENGKQQVNHINGDRADNCVSNLEWATPGENIRHSFRQLGRKSGNERAVIAEKAGSRLTFASVLDAARAGFNRRGIHNCLNGTYNQHKGFQWRYV